MRINRTALREVVQKTLDVAEAEHAEKVKAWEAYLVTYEREWVDEWGPQWAKAADEIRTAFQGARPITKNMLPNNGGSIEIYRPPEGRNYYNEKRPVKPNATHVPDKDLLTLREVLDLIDDTVVTPTGLSKLGITPATFRRALSQLGAKE